MKFHYVRDSKRFLVRASSLRCIENDINICNHQSRGTYDQKGRRNSTRLDVPFNSVSENGANFFMPAVSSTGPGATPTTRIPCIPHSNAKLRVRLSTAAFAAEAWACCHVAPWERYVSFYQRTAHFLRSASISHR